MESSMIMLQIQAHYFKGWTNNVARLELHEEDPLAKAIEMARARIEDDSDAHPDVAIIHELLVALGHEPKAPEEPAPPNVGDVVRARYDLECGGHGPWPKGWTGEVVNVPRPDEGDTLEVRAHRYIHGLGEWDNCRVIMPDDGHWAYENVHGRRPPADTDPAVLAAIVFHEEFEVIS